MAEYWDLYDGGRRPLGRLHRRGDEMKAGEYHLVVQIWTRDDEGRFLISQRHPDKPWPLFYETVGGSVVAGEDTLTGARRELEEEIGLTVPGEDMKLIGTINDGGNTIYDIFLVRWNGGIGALSFQETEVVGAQWMTFEELCALDDQGKLVPTLKYFRDWFAPGTEG